MCLSEKLKRIAAEAVQFVGGVGGHEKDWAIRFIARTVTNDSGTNQFIKLCPQRREGSLDGLKFFSQAVVL